MSHTVTAQAIRAELERQLTRGSDGFYIDHAFRGALAEGFPMYHDAPVIAKWAQGLGFDVVKTHDGARAGYAQTAEGIRLYRGGYVSQSQAS